MTATEVTEQSTPLFEVSGPELLLFGAGVVFTFAVLTVFIIVLRRDVKRDARSHEKRERTAEAQRTQSRHRDDD